MTNEELGSQLEALHKELEKANTLAPEDRDMLGRLMEDMVRIAQGEDISTEPKDTLRDQLDHKASDFEVGHPRLAAVIRQVMEALNKMGI